MLKNKPVVTVLHIRPPVDRVLLDLYGQEVTIIRPDILGLWGDESAFVVRTKRGRELAARASELFPGTEGYDDSPS